MPTDTGFALFDIQNTAPKSKPNIIYHVNKWNIIIFSRCCEWCRVLPVNGKNKNINKIKQIYCFVVDYRKLFSTLLSYNQPVIWFWCQVLKCTKCVSMILVLAKKIWLLSTDILSSLISFEKCMDILQIQQTWFWKIYSQFPCFNFKSDRVILWHSHTHQDDLYYHKQYPN